ncbi:hypothetical protein SAMN05192588_1615 [Nonlabens sp. Hel1_33_55]|uniref:hypothetical protein n=1 Tax=Nonlabens sp. Hel1_33_55 TaxID=1336802 RepID=UPI000875B520|nr:hypothetical protein [Nonlabens sp. Hel1_33_55]SCY19659.1 hypothetical protein SAMN05192588_1615 [Nonlabens sp. Hel1_33_55]
MKNIFTTALFLIALTGMAQTSINTVKINPERDDSQALSIIGQDSLVDILITNSKEIQHLDYQNGFQFAVLSTYESPRSKYGEISGYEVKPDGEINVYYSNSRKNKFCMVTINPTTKESVINEMDFRLKKETYLQGISHNNKFYILSIDYDAKLKLYEFDGLNNQVFELKTGAIKFEPRSDGSPNYLNTVLKSGGTSQMGSSLVDLIDAESPNSIETASKTNKLYTFQDHFILTIDRDEERTHALRISLTDKTVDVKTFDQPVEDFDRNRKDSNSYLYDGKLFQTLVSRDKLVLTITEFETKEQLKKVVLLKDEDIQIANSAIIQEGGEFSSYRELENTSQLLRKMTSATPGIPVYKIGGQYEITLGGSKELASGGAPMMMGFGLGGAIGGLIVSAVVNPTLGAYNSYTRTKSTYFISLFDEQFNHQPGEVQQNVFDRISSFTDGKDPLIETVFRYKGDFIYGYYNKDEDAYELVRFMD